MKHSILFISHERKMGGANLSLFDLIKELKKRGHIVYVAVLYRGCPIDVKLNEIGIETIPCLFGWWQQPKYWNKGLKIIFRLLHFYQKMSVIKLASFVNNKKIDIIHSNSSVIDIGAELAKITGKRHVWHFREYGDVDYQLEYMYGLERSIKYINSNSDSCIFISKALSKHYPDINNKTIIYDGISRERFNENGFDNDMNDNEKIISFIVAGNLIEGKNQQFVLEAVKELHDVNGENYVDESKYRIYIAGRSTDLKESKEYEKHLKEYTITNELKNIEFLGFVENIDELRKKASVEIVASRSEAYGRVIIEAMAIGDLVLAMNSGSAPELIGENERGTLFDNNVLDLARKMKDVIVNYSLYDNVRKAAYVYAYKNHASNQTVNDIENIYNQVLEH